MIGTHPRTSNEILYFDRVAVHSLSLINYLTTVITGMYTGIFAHNNQQVIFTDIHAVVIRLSDYLISSNHPCILSLPIGGELLSAFHGDCTRSSEIGYESFTTLVLQPSDEDVLYAIKRNTLLRLRKSGETTIIRQNWQHGYLIDLNFNSDASKLYLTSEKGIWIYELSNKQFTPLITSLGRSDGTFKQATVTSPAAPFLVDENLLLIAEITNNKLRVLNLVTSNVTSICSYGNGTEYRLGSPRQCTLRNPNSFLKHPLFKETFLIGGRDLYSITISGKK